MFIKETSGFVRPERVDKWPKSMIADDDDDDDDDDNANLFVLC